VQVVRIAMAVLFTVQDVREVGMVVREVRTRPQRRQLRRLVKVGRSLAVGSTKVGSKDKVVVVESAMAKDKVIH
jgi:hypothetical protein